jgi:hypothetical protein
MGVPVVTPGARTSGDTDTGVGDTERDCGRGIVGVPVGVSRSASLAVEALKLWVSRLRAAGKGKRGGVRVIYYGVTGAGQIWLLAIYAKAQRENLPAHVIRLLKQQMVKS